MLKNLRIKIFNWFAAGKITLTHNSQEYRSMSNYVVAGGGQGGSGGLSINPNGNMIYNTGSSSMQNNQTLTLRITPANGGTIVQINNSSEYGNSDLHIIPDGSDFDRELGKIITMSKLRS